MSAHASRLRRLIDRRGLSMTWRLGLLPALAVLVALIVADHTVPVAVAAAVVAFVASALFARLTLWPLEQMCRKVERITTHRLAERVVTPRGDDAVARLGRLLNAMLDRLEASTERQRRFTSDAAHELRSPVAAASAMLESALASGASEQMVPAIRGALVEQQRLGRIIDDLLLLATADEHGARHSQVEVDIDDLVFEATAAAGARGVVCVDTGRVGAGRVVGEPHLLASLIRNLIDNAERHAKTAIAVSLTESSKLVTLAVEDDGPGIPPDDRARIFERFGQLDASRRSNGSSGLGLALVQSIAQQHNAVISVGSSSLGGALFSVEFTTD